MAAVDFFLKLDGVEGESQDKDHKNEISLESFSFGADQSGTSSHGTGAGAGKVSMHDISVTKVVDKSSPVLFQNCASGSPRGSCLPRR